MNGFLLALALTVEVDPIVDMQRFQAAGLTHETAKAYYDFGNCHYWYAVRCELPAWYQKEVDSFRQTWSALECITDPKQSLDWKRRATVVLRSKIGDDAYSACYMPPPAPVWRFRYR